MSTSITQISFDETKTTYLKRVLSAAPTITVDVIEWQENGVVVEYVDDVSQTVRVFFPYSAIESIWQVL